MKKAVRKFWDRWFRGPAGVQGPKGDRGEDGYLQLSGFPDNLTLQLTVKNGELSKWMAIRESRDGKR